MWSFTAGKARKATEKGRKRAIKDAVKEIKRRIKIRANEGGKSIVVWTHHLPSTEEDKRQVLSWLKQNGYNVKPNELLSQGRVYTDSWTISWGEEEE